jgi:predicted acyltransferase
MSSDRISSIDIMRGLTLLLMLFVNDLNMDVAPAWLGHMKADFDGMGISGVSFHGRDGNSFFIFKKDLSGTDTCRKQ